ncbi:MAG: PAQR family membrane homeostasis protein TrhA [Clostridium sp.]
MKDINFYTKGEEMANAITHGIGSAFAIVGTVILILLAVATGDTLKIVGVSIYGASLIILYLGSTLYHSISVQKVKKVFRVLDHSSIYLLIVGTYTGIVLLQLSTNLVSWIILGVLWVMAIVGIVLKAICIDKFDKLSTLLYIIMGWAIVFNFKALIALVPFNIIMFLVAGGLAYTLGCIFYGNDKIHYNHAIWHLFVIAGSVLHFVCIYLSI